MKIVNYKHINRGIIMVLLPLSFMTLGLLTIQIIFPEFLYTAQALTLTALGLFFAIENPVEKFKNRDFIDANVQIWNRNCYEYDLEHIVIEKLHKGEQLTFVIGDEFVALYFNQSLDTVKKEISEVEKTCNSIKMDKDVLVGISIGYAKTAEGENVNDTFKRAEAMMYENKRMYYKDKGVNRRKN